ncbi:MAG: 5-methylcytosine restriction system specificity protein McrC [Coprobacillus cateniformis]
MIPIKNIYYMLTYAYSSLRGQGYRKISTEEFQNTADLMSAILVRAISNQLKKGLLKEYIPKTEEIQTLRGKIEISDSIRNQCSLRQRVVCSYEDFSVNNTLNCIIKTTLTLLLKMIF